MIVGLPSGGTDGGTVGTAFTDAQSISKSIAHYHKLGIGTKFDAYTFYILNENPAKYGTSGTVSSSAKAWTTNQSYGVAISEIISDGMSANTSVQTSDILAYIQLMAIKKD